MPDILDAVLDACVLYPDRLRDILLRCADADFYRPHWSNQIHEEWIRNLQADRPNLLPEKLLRTRTLMDESFPDALVTEFEPLIDNLRLPDPDDRHVLAAAIYSKSSVIVTFNLRHFPDAILNPFGVKAQHPDDFLLDRSKEQPMEFVSMVRTHRSLLTRPAQTAEEYIATLRRNQLVQLADFLTPHAAVL